MKHILQTTLLALLVLLSVACEKVSPQGVLMAGTAVDDRVKMSELYFRQHKQEIIEGTAYAESYSFLIGADSHVTTDTMRMAEYFQNGLDNDDMFWAHLGDIADTKPEYYIHLANTIETFKDMYIDKYFDRINDFVYRSKENGEEFYRDEIVFPFFPVVGNHDITHNGWALWADLFHTSFYSFVIHVGDPDKKEVDVFFFLDSASGTLGAKQIELIEDGLLDTVIKGFNVRNAFAFTHTNLFRPNFMQFASTFPREELYYLIDQFNEWSIDYAFCGHVHAWDEHTFGGCKYLTLDSMCEANNPKAGDYLVRVKVAEDGTISWEKVHMAYEPPTKK